MAYKFKIHGAGDLEFYSMEDARALLGISERTMRRRCKTGMIPTQKIKSRIYIPAPFVDRTRRQGWAI